LAFTAVLFAAAPSPAQERAPADPLAGALDLYRRGRYGEAETALERLATGPDEAPARLALGRLYLETGRFEAAARAAEAAARVPAQRSAAHTLLGEAQMARGRLDEAEAVLREAAADPAAHRARVMLGRLLLRRGREAEARSVLMQLVRAYNDGVIGPGDGEGIAYVAMAAAMLGSPHDANDAFRESVRAAPERVETHLAWAALFLSKYDTGHAEECLRDALRVNPEHPIAHAMMARVRLEQSFDFTGAAAELDRALAIHPNLVMAHVTRAAMALRDVDIAAADAHLDTALAIDPHDLEALSVHAAVRFVEGDTRRFRAAVRAVLDRNPRYSELYSIVADHADWEHRYAEIVDLAREALRIDPEDARAHATLGLNLLRIGREAEGLAALREAWRRDRFNVRVYNTLNLWDEVIVPQYETIAAPPFTFRMHREERPLIERSVVSTLRAAWNDMRRRYRFTPRMPVWIELFASPTHLSVRTAGLPHIGVQGVCFGQVVTAISPRGGPFDWGQITVHELAHVFHIQMSRNRVPRWFTEGLAEHETMRARPEWRREEDHRLFFALEGGRLPPVRDFNQAFTRARSAEDAMTAYYASSRLIAYLESRFGWDALVRMLRGWGEGRTTPDVVQRALGISIDDLDRDFRASERTRLAARARDFAVDFARYADLEAVRARANAARSDAGAQGELAAALLAHGDAAGAAAAAIEAIRLDARQPIARFVLARLAVERRDGSEAETHLAELIAGGHDGYEVRLLMARAAMLRSDVAGMRAALEVAVAIDSDRPEAWRGLLQSAELGRDPELRLRALRRLVDIDQHDRASLAALLDELAQREAWDELLAVAPRTVFVDPERGRGRYLHGEALLRAGRAAEALGEFDLALRASVELTGPIQLARARALAALGRRREAREAAHRAVAADPSFAPAASDLLR
jgi:tetratricopeptide (TPR) repeat protein